MSQQQQERIEQQPIKGSHEDVFSLHTDLAVKLPPQKDGLAIPVSATARSEKSGKDLRHTLSLPSHLQKGGAAGGSGSGSGPAITIGEALEATALTVGHKPVEWSDAAAIQAAEVRATGRINIAPGGVAAAAQSAATMNARIENDDQKTKLFDILEDATIKLSSDRPANRRDAEGVAGAEMRNDPNLTTRPAGVAASIAAAARLNQSN